MNYILGFILSLGITLPAYYKKALTGTGVLAAVALLNVDSALLGMAVIAGF